MSLIVTLMPHALEHRSLRTARRASAAWRPLLGGPLALCWTLACQSDLQSKLELSPLDAAPPGAASPPLTGAADSSPATNVDGSSTTSLTDGATLPADGSNAGLDPDATRPPTVDDGGTPNSPSESGSTVDAAQPEPDSAAPPSGMTDGGTPPQPSDVCDALTTRLATCGLMTTHVVVSACDKASPFWSCVAECLMVPSCNDLTASFCVAATPDIAVSCLNACYEAAPSTFLCDDNLTSYKEPDSCNIFASCADGSDEQGCTYFDCGDGFVTSTKFVCDFEEDCLNGADEQGCVSTCTPQ